MPHNHQHILATYHKAGPNELQMAIDGALDAWKAWSNTSLQKRISIFHKMVVGEMTYENYTTKIITEFK